MNTDYIPLVHNPVLKPSVALFKITIGDDSYTVAFNSETRMCTLTSPILYKDLWGKSSVEVKQWVADKKGTIVKVS